MLFLKLDYYTQALVLKLPGSNANSVSKDSFLLVQFKKFPNPSSKSNGFLKAMPFFSKSSQIRLLCTVWLLTSNEEYTIHLYRISVLAKVWGTEKRSKSIYNNKEVRPCTSANNNILLCGCCGCFAASRTPKPCCLITLSI